MSLCVKIKEKIYKSLIIFKHYLKTIFPNGKHNFNHILYSHINLSFMQYIS